MKNRFESLKNRITQKRPNQLNAQEASFLILEQIHETLTEQNQLLKSLLLVPTTKASTPVIKMQVDKVPEVHKKWYQNAWHWLWKK